MKILSIETPTHGRILIEPAAAPRGALVGFHGYMENAAIQMTRLQALHLDGWTRIAVQGLHRFYRGRSNEVIASWMTREDREDMIGDNIAWADRAIDAAAPDLRVVTLGFSQGVAMAFRSAVRGRRRAAGVVAVGGDIPPELLADPAAMFPPTLLLRGERDEWYTATRIEADAAALAARGVRVEVVTYPGVHEWTPGVSAAASTFVQALGFRL